MQASNKNTYIIIGIVIVLVIGAGVIFATKASAPGSAVENDTGGSASTTIDTSGSTANPGNISPSASSTQSATTSDAWKPIEISGTTICLPHKNSEGPQTLECAIGLNTQGDVNYALDTSALGNAFLDTGENLHIKGMLTPVEALSSDNWKNYTIAGIIKVESAVKE